MENTQEKKYADVATKVRKDQMARKVRDLPKVSLKTLVQERRQMVAVRTNRYLDECPGEYVVVALDALTPSEREQIEEYWAIVSRLMDDYFRKEHNDELGLTKSEQPKLSAFLQGLKEAMLILGGSAHSESDYCQRLDLNKRLWPTTHVLKLSLPHIIVESALDFVLCPHLG